MSLSVAWIVDLLPVFVGSSRSFGLLLYQQWDMLFTKAECASPCQQLSVGSGFSAAIATPNMCFYGFHI
jgi:hypothetical protein